MPHTPHLLRMFERRPSVHTLKEGHIGEMLGRRPSRARSARSGSISSRVTRASTGTHHYPHVEQDVEPFREEVFREEEREQVNREIDEGLTPAEIEAQDKEAEAEAAVETGFLVEFAPGDPENPRNWSFGKKWCWTLFFSFLCFVVAVGSSMPTAALIQAGKQLHVSQEAVNLSISLFVAGFGFGPVFFAPLSEMFGRKPVYVVSGFLYFIFTLPCAVTNNLATLLAARMISGLAASVPMTNVGGSISDMWVVEEKGNPMNIFSSVLFLGPALGPLVGGAISSGTNEEEGWHYIYWTLFAFVGLTWIASLSQPETLGSVILKKRARRLRKETGDERYSTVAENEKMSLKAMIVVLLLRPVIMLFVEPILLFFSLYLTLVYMLLYLMFFAYPIIFLEGHGMNDLQTGLMFIPLVVGILIAILLTMFVLEPHVKKRVARRGTRQTPEDRLLIMFVGSIMFPISLFTLAWTSMPSVHWTGAMMTGLGTGLCFVMVYNSANTYLVDCYPKTAASALASKTLVRSMGGAAVPLFVNQMFHSMHNQWALTLLALVSAVMLPIPFFFYMFGPKFRARSKYATGDE